MNSQSTFDAAAMRGSLATTTRRGAPTAVSSRKQQLLLGAMAMLAGTYAFGVSAPAQAYAIRHDFCAPGCPSDGWQPEASLILDGTHLYGTTAQGGTHGYGTVFRVKPAGTGYAVRYSFAGFPGDGAYPEAGLVQSGSLLYGTTYQGGQYNFGTVFCLKSSGGAEFAHYSFGGSATDGTYPQAGLTLVNGWLYGTTAHGGAYGSGTVFRINTKCGQEQVLYSFGAVAGDGAWPSGTLYYANNLLYGTTQAGGSGCNCGTVFSVTTAGAETPMYAFTGNPGGSSPRGGVVYDSVTGLLFGTTEYGGQSLGTVFSIPATCPIGCTPNFYAFQGTAGTPPDGLYPYGNLIEVGTMLYGTTLYGGSSTNCGANGCGTIFQVPVTTGPLTETNLHSFSGTTTDGYAPAAGLLYDGGSWYGTTASGGNQTSCGVTSGCGTVFVWP